MYMYVALFAVITWIVGVIYCIVWIASHNNNTHSISNEGMKNIQMKVNDIFAAESSANGGHPKWGSYDEFWTPVLLDLNNIDEPIIVFCKIDYKLRWESPHTIPMFRDLIVASKCGGSNAKSASLSAVKADPDFQGIGGRYNSPGGFVFHESRVGSTLVINALACDPWAIAISESDPPMKALAGCTKCSREQRILLFQEVVKLMGYSTYHQRLYFKFQSAATAMVDVVLEAFPNVPWVFLFRQPVQVLMSHLDPKRGGGYGAPCLRSKGLPQAKQSVNLFRNGSLSNAHISDTEWCANHLHMLCESAVMAYDQYSRNTSGKQRGAVIDYSSLPGSITRIIYPLFDIKPTYALVSKVSYESGKYSKSRGPSKIFSPDSEDKDARATEVIVAMSKIVLRHTFESLATRAEGVAQMFLTDTDKSLMRRLPDMPGVDWQCINKIVIPPRESLSSSFIRNVLGSFSSHSKPIKPVAASQPFGNTHTSKPLDKVNCPAEPPIDYPIKYNMTAILSNWNADITDIPPIHFDSLCHFDYSDPVELAKALNYREHELPFVAYNVPEVDNVVKKWSDIDYLRNKLGHKEYRTETSKTNHFMYWRKTFFRNPDGSVWKPPTSVIDTTFEDWVGMAVKGQELSLEERTHQYFRVSSDMGNPWLFDELPFFQPVKSLFIVKPKEQRGIHCRFGMRSVIAEAHFDASRNFIAMLGGMRRWILTAPDQCADMYMLPMNHPSGRHSEMDWSDLNLEKYPNFERVKGLEVILQPGDVLYVPTFWIHYIVSLNVNYQCNTRSGATREHRDDMKKCGF